MDGNLLSRTVAVCAMLFLGLALPIGLLELLPPEPRAADAPATAFSAERAMVHVRAVASRPHPMGSAAHAVAREYIVAELRRLGLEPRVETARVSLTRGGVLTLATVRNILARRPGTRGGGKAIMLACHYDSVPTGPGAGDDASGVAAVLETLRALAAGEPLANDVIALFTDGEEIALLGANAFCAGDPWLSDVGVVLNFEARGGRGASFMFETSPGNAALIDALAATPAPASSSAYYEAYRRMPNGTDLTVFKRAGLPGMNFAFIGGLSHYHTMWDTPDRLDRGSVQHHGDHALHLTRRLDDVDLTTLTPAADPIYFTPLGQFLVRYPQSWALPILLLASLLLVIGGVIGVRKDWLHLRGLLYGAMVLPITAGLSTALFLGIRALIRDAGAVVAFVPALVEDEERFMIGILLLMVSIGVVIMLQLRTRAKIDGMWAGALAWWWLLAAVTSLKLKLVSYLFVWPLLFGALGLILLVTRPRRQRVGVGRAIAVCLSTAPAVILMLPLIWGVFLALRLGRGELVVLATVLLLGLLTPVLLFAMSHLRWLIPVTSAACGFALLAHTTLGGGVADPGELPEPLPGPPLVAPTWALQGEVVEQPDGRTAEVECHIPADLAWVIVEAKAGGRILAIDGLDCGGRTAVRVLAPETILRLRLAGAADAAIEVSALLHRYRPPQRESDQPGYDVSSGNAQW